MQVAQLRMFVENLARFLAESGGTQVGRELQRAADALRPFDQRTIAQFEEFLKRADQFDRTGQVPVSKRAGAGQSATDEAKVAQAAEMMRQLYDRATDPALSYQQIDAEVAKLNRTLNKNEAVAVAERLGVPRKKTKKDALAEIGHWIREYKRTGERSSF